MSKSTKKVQRTPDDRIRYEEQKSKFKSAAVEKHCEKSNQEKLPENPISNVELQAGNHIVPPAVVGEKVNVSNPNSKVGCDPAEVFKMVKCESSPRRYLNFSNI